MTLPTTFQNTDPGKEANAAPFLLEPLNEDFALGKSTTVRPYHSSEANAAVGVVFVLCGLVGAFVSGLCLLGNSQQDVRFWAVFAVFGLGIGALTALPSRQATQRAEREFLEGKI